MEVGFTFKLKMALGAVMLSELNVEIPIVVCTCVHIFV
jgi:hypothetical protein